MAFEIWLEDERRLWKRLWKQTSMVNSPEAWVAGYGKLCGLDGLHLIRGERVCLWDRLARAGRRQLCRNITCVRSGKKWKFLVEAISLD